MTPGVQRPSTVASLVPCSGLSTFSDISHGAFSVRQGSFGLSLVPKCQRIARIYLKASSQCLVALGQAIRAFIPVLWLLLLKSLQPLDSLQPWPLIEGRIDLFDTYSLLWPWQLQLLLPHSEAGNLACPTWPFLFPSPNSLPFCLPLAPQFLIRISSLCLL